MCAPVCMPGMPANAWTNSLSTTPADTPAGMTSACNLTWEHCDARRGSSPLPSSSLTRSTNIPARWSRSHRARSCANRSTSSKLTATPSTRQRNSSSTSTEVPPPTHCGAAAIGISNHHLVPSDYTITAGNAMEPFFRKVRTALEESAIPVEVSQVEYGLGQWEINLEYGTALEMADRHVLFKQVVHDVAAAEGLTATFMARPSTDGMGSSCHIHASMRSDDTFPFHDESAENTASAELLHAVGGVLEHCPELMLFYTPTINSMRRTRASHDFSGGNGLTWGGFDNRTTTCRLITGGAPSANRLEMRLPGADANPYLALAAVLASMNDGLTRKLDPGAPVRRDGYSDTDTLEKVKQQPLPGTLDEAARALEASEFALAAFGAEVVSHYAAVAKDEWDSFMSAVTDWERERYLDNI